MAKMSEQEAMDIILKYLIDNSIDNPMYSGEIWKNVFPDEDELTVNILLKKIIDFGGDILIIDLNDADIHNFGGYFEATSLTKKFLFNQGGFTALYKKQDEENAERVRIEKLNTKKLESEVDLIDFQKGFGRKLTIWGFVIAVLSVLASVGTTLIQTRSNASLSPKVEVLTSRIDSLNDTVKSIKLRLQKVEQIQRKQNQYKN